MPNENSKGIFTKAKELLMYPIRKRQELEKQKREGYEVKFPSGSRGEYVVYREGAKSLWAYIDMSQGGEVRLYTQTLKAWETPVKGKKLNQAEYNLVVKRICDFLSLESEAILDNSPLMTHEEQLASMKTMGERGGWTLVNEDGQIKFIKESPKS